MPVRDRWQGLLFLLLLAAAILIACDDAIPQAPAVRKPQMPKEASAQQARQENPRGSVQRPQVQVNRYLTIPTQNATISISRTNARFSGYIDDQSVLALIFGTSRLAEHIDTVVITSRDGLPSAARRLGLWLFINQIALEIEEACLSVCAEYVFPGAATKLIRERAIVAWLGERRIQITGEEQELAKKFFATVRGSPEISSWSELVAGDAGSGVASASFWTVSIADMARLGIANVSYEGEREYPSESVLEGESVVLLDVPTAVAPPLREPLPEQEYLLLRTRFDRGDVSVEGGTATYVGYLTRRAVNQLLRDASLADPTVDTLVIASGGGDTGLGQEVGNWVYENQITVVVEGTCFSSCANYIFTAAPTKVIRESAVVGWHGSQQQGKYISTDGKCLTSVDSDGDNSDSPASSGFAIRQQGLGVEEEVEFLDKIGVSVDALLYGHMPERCEHYVLAGVAGWTFSLDDMATFGVTDVTYEGDGEYPGPHRPGRVPLIVYDLGGAPPWLLGASPLAD